MSKENIDPVFDGHPERSILEMTPGERLDYLWELIEFSEIVKNRKVVPKQKITNKQDSTTNG